MQMETSCVWLPEIEFCPVIVRIPLAFGPVVVAAGSICVGAAPLKGACFVSILRTQGTGVLDVVPTFSPEVQNCTGLESCQFRATMVVGPEPEVIGFPLAGGG